MKILIIGINSILGVAIYDLHKKKGDNVIGVFNKRKDRIKGLNVINKKDIDKVGIEIDVVYFFSAHISYLYSDESTKQFYDVNIKFLKEALNLFPNSKFVYSSSVSLYNNEGIIFEESKIQLENEYQISKYWGEHIVKNHKSGFAIFRISSLFGNNMNENTFLPKIINQAIKNKKIVLYGKGERKQNYISVNLLSHLMYCSIDCSINGIFLGVSNMSFSNIDIAKLVISEIEDCTTVFQDKDDSSSFIYDNNKSLMLLDFKNKNFIKEDLLSYVRWKIKKY